VLTVISDRKLAHTTTPTSGIIDYYNSEILSSSDGYVFHQTMPNRSYNSNSYRYGLSNGQEKDNEIFEGAFTAEYWEYDSRTGRRWNVDPVVKPWESSYACFANNPIYYADPSGLDGEGPNGECPGDPPAKAEGGGDHTYYTRPVPLPDPDRFWSRGGDAPPTEAPNKGSNGEVNRKAENFSMNLGNIAGFKKYPWILPLYQTQSVNYYNTHPWNNGLAPTEVDYTVLLQGRIFDKLQWAYYMGKQKIDPLGCGVKPEAPSFVEIGVLYRILSLKLAKAFSISMDIGATGGKTFAELYFADGSGNTITEPNLVLTNPFGNQRYSYIGKSASLIFKLTAETTSGFALFGLINAHHYQGTEINTSIGNVQIPQLGTMAVTVGASYLFRTHVPKKN
jgi:hypothetical protein